MEQLRNHQSPDLERAEKLWTAFKTQLHSAKKSGWISGQNYARSFFMATKIIGSKCNLQGTFNKISVGVDVYI